MSESLMTDENGQFNFEELPLGQDYVITPQKDNEPMNGVSTYDLVLMSRHILQVDELDSPYKLIAADVNRSGGLTTNDMVQLRKLILFIDTTFVSNTSWRFIDKDFVFPVSADPFSLTFPEVYYADNAIEDQQIEFVAIKTGDVNGSVSANGFQGGAERSPVGALDLWIADQELKAGEEYRIPVRSDAFSNISGLQLSWQADMEAMEWLGVSGSERIGMRSGNFGLRLMDQGVITCSWHQWEKQALADEQVLFELKIRAKSNARLSEVLQLSTAYTPAEAYTHTDDWLQPQLRFDDSKVQANAFQLFQNQPNPFRETTVIAFQLPEASPTTLRIYDAAGRLIYTDRAAYQAGYHEVNIHRSDLPDRGVLYYQLETPQHLAIRKMTLLE
ncbi:MAG: T9SS type A sorting domain-containing protein [Bacteroidota bacterium]